MTKPFLNVLIFLFLSTLPFSSCRDSEGTGNINKDEKAIRQLHRDYVDGWLKMDEEKVMGLLDENSRIQPSLLKPITGKPAIREFWFPKDGSKTTINAYETEIISLEIMDTLAISTHTSLLDWSYQKDTLEFGRRQKGINTTVYRKGTADSWKIWRSMWTDIYAEPR